MDKKSKFWGWGYEGDSLDTSEQTKLFDIFGKTLGFTLSDPVAAPRLDDIDLTPSRLDLPASLTAISSSDPYDRALHHLGKS